MVVRVGARRDYASGSDLFTEEVPMSNNANRPRPEVQGPKRTHDDNKPVKTLDVRTDEAAKVKAGRRLIEDPCTGGE